MVLYWEFWAVSITCHIWLKAHNIALYLDLFDYVFLEPIILLIGLAVYNIQLIFENAGVRDTDIENLNITFKYSKT